MAVIEAMKTVEGVIVGAGTVTRVRELEAVRYAGGRFAVSPGLVPELLQASHVLKLPLLPGVMTPTEALTGLNPSLSIFATSATFPRTR